MGSKVYKKLPLVVNAMYKFRHAFFEIFGQIAEIIDIGCHQRMGHFVGNGAVQVACIGTVGFAVFIGQAHIPVVGHVNGEGKFAGYAAAGVIGDIGQGTGGTVVFELYIHLVDAGIGAEGVIIGCRDQFNAPGQPFRVQPLDNEVLYLVEGGVFACLAAGLVQHIFAVICHHCIVIDLVDALIDFLLHGCPVCIGVGVIGRIDGFFLDGFQDIQGARDSAFCCLEHADAVLGVSYILIEAAYLHAHALRDGIA